MINYIKTGTPKKSKIKKYLAIGTAIAVITGAGYVYQDDAEFWKPRVHTVLGINSPESLEYRIDSIREDLKEYPQYTDRLAKESMEAIRESGQDFSTETYLEMFDVMKDKFENKPQLLDHLGPAAMKYQDSRLARKYKKGIDGLYQHLKDKALETKDRLQEMMD